MGGEKPESLILEPEVGFEPTAYALRKHCSAAELLRRSFTLFHFFAIINHMEAKDKAFIQELAQKVRKAADRL